MTMLNPPHPGLTIKEILLPDNNLTMSEAATHLRVSRSTLSRVANGHAEISPEMAVRLETVFGGSAAHWLRMQASYNLAQARQRFSTQGIRSITPRTIRQNTPRRAVLANT